MLKVLPAVTVQKVEGWRRERRKALERLEMRADPCKMRRGLSAGEEGRGDKE